MKDFDERLIKLVEKFSQKTTDGLSFEKKQFSDKEKLDIKTAFIALICHYLTYDGVEEEKVAERAKQLRIRFHPDRLNQEIAAIRWLEHTLSDGENNGTIFIFIQECVDSLQTTLEDQADYFTKVKSIDTLLELLKKSKKQARTMSQTTLLESLIGLLKSVIQYHRDMTQLNGDSIPSRILQVTPYLLNSACLALILDKMFLFFAATFLLTKGGLLLQSIHSPALQILGSYMRAFGFTLAQFAVALLAQGMKLNFALTQSCNYLGVEAVKSVLQLMYPVNIKTPQNLADDLIKVDNHWLDDTKFKELELKLIAYPLEQYVQKQEQQFLSKNRLGYQKNQAFRKAIGYMEQIGQKDESLFEKMERIGIMLEKLSQSSFLKKPGKATRALETAKALQKKMVNEHDVFQEQINKCHSLPLAIEYKQETTEEEEDAQHHGDPTLSTSM